jgi:hypothetical protein
MHCIGSNHRGSGAQVLTPIIRFNADNLHHFLFYWFYKIRINHLPILFHVSSPENNKISVFYWRSLMYFSCIRNCTFKASASIPGFWLVNREINQHALLELEVNKSTCWFVFIIIIIIFRVFDHFWSLLVDSATQCVLALKNRAILNKNLYAKDQDNSIIINLILCDPRDIFLSIKISPQNGWDFILCYIFHAS